jgi:hypothetical protein
VLVLQTIPRLFLSQPADDDVKRRRRIVRCWGIVRQTANNIDDNSVIAEAVGLGEGGAEGREDWSTQRNLLQYECMMLRQAVYSLGGVAPKSYLPSSPDTTPAAVAAVASGASATPAAVAAVASGASATPAAVAAVASGASAAVAAVASGASATPAAVAAVASATPAAVAAVASATPAAVAATASTSSTEGEKAPAEEGEDKDKMMLEGMKNELEEARREIAELKALGENTTMMKEEEEDSNDLK